MGLQAPLSVILLFSLVVLGITAVQLSLWSRYSANSGTPTLSWFSGLFVSFVGTVILTGWIGVLLVSFGFFSLLNVSLGLLWVAVGIGVWQRPFSVPRFLPLLPTEWIVLLLMLGSAVVYFRPHEYVLGGIDPGVYVNMAATAVQTGSFITEDPWTAQMAQFPDVSLREQPPQWRTRYLQFVGWYIDDQEPSRSIPQFFPFHSILLAVGMGLGGLYAGLFVTPLWGVLSLTAVYLTTRQLFNDWVGLIAALLLAITPTHIYFARYPTTEPLTLLLVFTGLFAFQKLWDKAVGEPLWGGLMGAAFGVAFLTRIDLPVVALLLVGFMILRLWQKGWHQGWTVGATVLGVLSLHAGLSAWLLNAPYVWNTYGGVATLLGGSTLVIGIAGVGLITASLMLLLMWRTPWLTFLNSSVGRFLRQDRSRWSIAVGILLLSLSVYFIRPILQPAVSYPSWPTGAEAFLLDGENWVRLGWYLTPLGL